MENPIAPKLPKNTVELRIVINRHTASQRGIFFYRNGKGDDMVDSAADYFEQVFTAAMHSLLEQSGGQWKGGPPPPDPSNPDAQGGETNTGK